MSWNPNRRIGCPGAPNESRMCLGALSNVSEVPRSPRHLSLSCLGAPRALGAPGVVLETPLGPTSCLG
eukprot:6365036-Lingulodinium_polyedra.AAC.1